jgi:hypothetical protein
MLKSVRCIRDKVMGGRDEAMFLDSIRILKFPNNSAYW